MGGTLIAVAKDVKIQVEFNPAQVAGYRLVGYENRLLNQEDFDDDRVDAGEIGSGHSVTALYEIIPAGKEAAQPQLKVPGLRYGDRKQRTFNGKAVRYKAPNGNTSKLLEYPIESAAFQEKLSENLTLPVPWQSLVCFCGTANLRGSADYDQVIALAESCIGQDTDDYRKEFLELVTEAAELYP